MLKSEETYTTVVKDLDSNHTGVLGDTKLPAGDSPRAVRSMAIRVNKLSVRKSVVSKVSPPLKLGMVAVDASIENVRPRAIPGRVVIAVLVPVGSAMRDGSKTPGRWALSDDLLVELKLADWLDGDDLLM